ncbi:MAG: asparaginase [Oscillospiraceae bacterium]|nr:asparaginase [Oscillospiraceae bacterium]
MEKTRIALLLTGGTICCRTSQEGVRRSDVAAATTILEQYYYETHPDSVVEFDVKMPLNRLSEDLTPDDWVVLLRSIASLNLKEYNGILIAHGTDTLEQTSAMLSAVLYDISIPVLLISAISPLDDALTNGHINFANGVRMIENHVAPGVWAVYANSDGEVYLHRGFDLQPCLNNSIDFFSTTMKTVDYVLEHREMSIRKASDMHVQMLQNHMDQKADVLLIRPYNGLRYDKMVLDDVAAVVHGTYHSETANAIRFSPYGMQTLIERCSKRGIPCYLVPCHMSEQDYGSGYDLVQGGAIPLENMSAAFAYGAVWFYSMCGLRGDVLTQKIRQVRQSLESQLFLCCM